MSKRTGIGIIIGVLILSSVGYVLAKKFVYNWKYDVHWQGERIASIRYFSGCDYRPQLIEGDDNFFTSEWNNFSKEYEFIAEDIDKEIPNCLSEWKKNDIQQGMSVSIDKLEVYQKKFLNRGFSALKK